MSLSTNLQSGFIFALLKTIIVSRIKANVFSTAHRPAVSDWFERNYQIGNISGEWGWWEG